MGIIKGNYEYRTDYIISDSGGEMKIEVRLLLIEQHSVIGFKVTFCRADANKGPFVMSISKVLRRAPGRKGNFTALILQT